LICASVDLNTINWEVGRSYTAPHSVSGGVGLVGDGTSKSESDPAQRLSISRSYDIFLVHQYASADGTSWPRQFFAKSFDYRNSAGSC
jgi:hypothetical protein